MTPMTIALFLIAVAAQLASVALLPPTHGFSRLGPTVLCCALFLLGVGVLARLTYSGVQLSILIPLMGAVIPLASIAIGILLYGESASASRVALLVVSCVLIGVAAHRG